MVLGSLTARIWATNKNLRFRKKTPYMGRHGFIATPALYRRNDYLGFCLHSSDVFVRSKPALYRKITNLIDRKDIVEMISYPVRGREAFVRMMKSRRLIGRAGYQLLKL